MHFNIDDIIIKQINNHFEVSYHLTQSDGASFRVRRQLPSRIYSTNRVTSLLKRTLIDEEAIDRGEAHSATIRIKARRCRLIEKKQVNGVIIPFHPTSSSHGIQSLTQEVQHAKEELQNRADLISQLEEEIAELKAQLNHLMEESHWKVIPESPLEEN